MNIYTAAFAALAVEVGKELRRRTDAPIALKDCPRLVDPARACDAFRWALSGNTPLYGEVRTWKKGDRHNAARWLFDHHVSLGVQDDLDMGFPRDDEPAYTSGPVNLVPVITRWLMGAK